MVLCVLSMLLAASQLRAFPATGQTPDLVLSVPGQNDSGGGLLFNHPGSIATDGLRLVVADRFNNRVLIWHHAPSGNTPPDLVLGQPSFIESHSGSGLDQMNFPGQVSLGGGKLIVADSNNDRILIWDTFPTRSGQPADRAVTYPSGVNALRWPWGVWSDGRRLMATSTSNGKVLVWNDLPAASGVPPDYTLAARNAGTGTNRFGTPRFISTDGRSYLIVGDHNAQESSSFGAFFWNYFPTSENSPYSFFGWGFDRNQFPSTGFLASNGQFALFTTPAVSLWNAFPTASNVNSPDLVVTSAKDLFEGGDAGGMVQTQDGRVYICAYNGNRIQGFHQLPSNPRQEPDFVIGAPDIYTNTLQSEGFITNAQLASDGTSLFAASGFERRMFVWSDRPVTSGQAPDFVLDYDRNDSSENFAPVDIDLRDGALVAAGGNTVKIWTRLPRKGEDADRSLQKIGSVDLGTPSAGSENIGGVAWDGRYFYLSMSSRGKVYVWSGLPQGGDEPLAVLSAVNIPGRIASNGKLLAVISISPTSTSRSVQFFDVETISSSSAPIGALSNAFSLPQQTQPGAVATMDIAWDGDEIYMSDGQNHLIYAWRDVRDAMRGSAPDAVLGSKTTHGGVNLSTFSRPAGLAVVGGRLWVGEFKFSNRILGFSPLPSIGGWP